ncbi:hypothetical protein LK09_18140 [Microbacterium mangrovi]|uniref:Uncharacterized protein n=2 Tax=Microbacterium mangrovi TaxID=1348253 RepID=A0A0B2A1X5_9MICO|nr:hypothetical protein LK09_18140 [Microbacterium mangrovi]
MPAVLLEVAFPRVVWWFAIVVNVILATFLSAGAVDALIEVPPWEPRWTVVLFAVAALWWAMTANVFILVLYRPRRSLDSVYEASQQVPGAVVLPGSQRLPVDTFIAAIAMTVMSITVAVAATGGWRVFWGAVALILVVVVVDQSLSVRHRRRVVLTPTGIRAVGFRQDAEVAWDDIGTLRWKQGTAWMMVARITVKPDAQSYAVHWRHPFAIRRRTIDVELFHLDLDPLLVMMALNQFLLVPASRAELTGPQVPLRFFDIGTAVDTVPPALGSDWLTTFRPR